MGKTAIMICGHGSRDTDAISEFERVVAGLKERLSDYPLTHGFLEFAQPIIRNGLDQLVADGASRILALPGMLFAAAHAKNDIPSVLNRYAAEHPGVTIDYGRELAVDLKLLRVARDRIEAAEAAAGDHIGRDETCLVVVGRGAARGVDFSHQGGIAYGMNEAQGDFGEIVGNRRKVRRGQGQGP